MPNQGSLLDLFAGIGAITLLWTIVQRLLPPLAEWRSAELGAWAAASRQFWPRISHALRQFIRDYRAEDATPRSGATQYERWVAAREQEITRIDWRPR